MSKPHIPSALAAAFLLSGLLLTPALRAETQPINLASDFRQQQIQITNDLGDGATYVEIKSDDRARVNQALDRMARLLDSASSIDSLTEADRVALFNDQEIVNGILTRAKADSRLVCDRRALTGSHRRTTSCMTVAERNRLRELSTDTVRETQRNTRYVQGP